jgi:hypothetical protein
MNLRKVSVLGTVLTLGLFLISGCNVSPFNPESNIEIAYIRVQETAIEGSGASVQVDIRPASTVHAFSDYAITVVFRVYNLVGVYLQYYQLEYYKPNTQGGWTKVDYFIHEGQPVYLGRKVYMNLYIPPNLYGAEYSEMGKEVFVVTQDVIDYADDTPDLHHLQVDMTFIGSDANENSIKRVGTVNIEFQRD